MMRRVAAILLAATTPAASFKLPWSRSVEQHSLTKDGLAYNND